MTWESETGPALPIPRHGPPEGGRDWGATQGWARRSADSVGFADSAPATPLDTPNGPERLPRSYCFCPGIYLLASLLQK